MTNSRATIAVMLETDGPGGAESLVHDLCVALRSRGHRVLAVGPLHGEGWLSARVAASEIPRRSFFLRRAIDPGAVVRLRSMLRDARVDVVHSHEFTMAVYGCAAARSLGLRHVITIHGDQGVTAALRRRIALRWAFRNSHAAVAVSTGARDALAARLGIEPRSIGVVPNGVPPPRGSRERLRRELSLPEDRLLVVAVGSLRPNKAHALLVRALARVPEHPWHLAIAGQGPEREPIIALARELGVAARVTLLGQRDDIGDIHAAADLFAMPSYGEGLPLALLEAMHSGAAIVASRVGGIPETARHEQEALLVAPGDVDDLHRALARLLSDPVLRRRLGAAAAARASAEFSIDRMTERYLELYGL